MDELGQMTAELNRCLERIIAGLRARRSGLTDGRYPVQPVEQGMSPRFDREQHVLLSRPRATPDCVQEHSRKEVKRYRAADQPPLGRVWLAPLEPLYRYVQQA